MAESKGFFGVLPYAFASLRSLTTDFQTVHRTVFIGEADRPCSNPLLKITQRKTRHSKRYTLFSWRRARDSAHFVRRKVCYANYPDYRLLLTRLRLAKDCKGSNSINNLQKNKGYSKCYTLYFLAESKGFFRRTAVRLRIASLFNHGLSNSPPDCFHRQSRPSLFESLAVLSTKKQRVQQMLYPLFYGGEQGIRTLETVLAVYTISNRAPSTSSDNSPCHL